MEVTDHGDLIRTLRGAGHIAVLTGAGISAESGIPTFRDAMSGLWARFRPEDLATPAAFARDPHLVWDWYRWRRELVDAAEPNEGHRALVTLSDLVPELTLITQNVDGLHTRAGSSDVLELHGSILRARCVGGCAGSLPWSATDDWPPRCRTCGALLRPDIVWFGEALPERELARAVAAAESCDVLLSIGTSNLVQPAASLPWLAAQRGATVVVINPDLEGQRSGPKIALLAGRAGEVLPQLVARLRNP
jgi:NAD-dependent deacetylase